MTRLPWPMRLMTGSPASWTMPIGLVVMSKVLPSMSSAGALASSSTLLPPMASWGEA